MSDYAKRNTNLLRSALKIADQVELNKRVDFLASEAADYFVVSSKQILGTSKNKQAVLARNLLWYLLNSTGYDFYALARAFSRKNHTTTLRGTYKIKRILKQNTYQAKRLRGILRAIKKADVEYTLNRTDQIATVYSRDIKNPLVK